MRSRILRPGEGPWASFLEDVPHDFYHLPAYVELCAAQEGGEARALHVQDGQRAMLLPIIVRPIPKGGHDASSPYGYPGPLLNGTEDRGFLEDALAEGIRELESEGLVSLFVRMHPLLNRAQPTGIGVLVRHGDTVAIDLTLPSDALWSQTRRGHRYDINRLLKAGHHLGIDTDPPHFETFRHLYRRTMARVSADAYYFFDDAYFDGLQEALGSLLHLAVVEIDGIVAAAGLITETCGIVQMHLEASDERFARLAPGKLIYHGVRSWAKERGDRWFHLGGGLGAADDSSMLFKAGFSPLRQPFHTLRVVISEPEYRRLVTARDPSLDPGDLGGFFPLYRRGHVADH